MLDADTFKKFLRYRKSLEIDKDPDLLRCPRTECEAVLKKSSLKQSKLKNRNWSCTSCNLEICSKCFLVAHPNKKCPSSNESSFRLWAASGLNRDWLETGTTAYNESEVQSLACVERASKP